MRRERLGIIGAGDDGGSIAVVGMFALPFLERNSRDAIFRDGSRPDEAANAARRPGGFLDERQEAGRFLERGLGNARLMPALVAPTR